MKLQLKLKSERLKDYEIDAHIDFIDGALLRGEFGLIDALLEYVSVHIMDFTSDHIITYLTATYPAKSKLPHRNNVYIKAKRFFTKEELKGLET